MRKIYENGGGELATHIPAAKDRGVTTSLDMTFPDPASESGKADWPDILGKALPFVDIFLPSFEELLFCLRRQAYDDLELPDERLPVGCGVLRAGFGLGSQILEMGVKIAVIKLGDRGLYVRTADAPQLAGLGPALQPTWPAGRTWSCDRPVSRWR